MDLPDPWPLRHLELRTPRLSLRPDDDEGLCELAQLAVRGVHPPEQMPFSVPWTDEPADQLVRGTMQHFWHERASLAVQNWAVNLLVRDRGGGAMLGMQTVRARDFHVTREISTGSWLGQQHQGGGYGTEMRAAVLQLAFDHLHAATARSESFSDNPASRAVSTKLGYRPDGTASYAPRGARVSAVRLVLSPDEFVRPDWTVQVRGLDGCRAMLGAD